MTASFQLPELAQDEDKSSPLKNRIRKTYRHVRKWAKRTVTNCFRIYDRDIKEYPLAIDYWDGHILVHFFSYDRENEEPSHLLKEEIEKTLLSLFGQAIKNIFWKTRKKRQKIEQYEKFDVKKTFITCLEYGVKFKINLEDYLDTGLFLDHRETRQIVAKASQGKRLLNLFAYTCSFSVQAAHLGACFTKSVDLSNTYTTWGKENFLLNHLTLENNVIERGDCLKFIEEEGQKNIFYDVIIIDPPTLSRSKKMDQFFDVQEDYPDLLKKALLLLAEEGILFFSTNFRKFKMDGSLFAGFTIQDISEKTFPIDFHNKKIHQCWKFTRTKEA